MASWYSSGMGQPFYEAKTVRDHGIITNVETGEVIEATFEHQVPEAVTTKRFRRSRRVGMSFVMVDAQSISELELVPTEQRVLGALLGVADKADQSRSRISTTMIAERAGMTPSNASKVISGLRKRRIVFKEGPGYWRVTPWYAFAGAWPDWDKVAKSFPEPEWKR